MTETEISELYIRIQIIDELDTSQYHKIQIRNRAFKQLGTKSD